MYVWGQTTATITKTTNVITLLKDITTNNNRIQIYVISYANTTGYSQVVFMMRINHQKAITYIHSKKQTAQQLSSFILPMTEIEIPYNIKFPPFLHLILIALFGHTYMYKLSNILIQQLRLYMVFKQTF